MADGRSPRQQPERGEVGHREHVGIAAVPIGQPQPVDDGAVGVPAQRGLTEGEPVSLCAVEELRCGYPLALRVAERVAPRHFDLGQRAVGKALQQVALSCRRVHRLRHDAVTVLSESRVPMTAPSANEPTTRPMMTHARMLEPPTKSLRLARMRTSDPASPTSPSAGAIHTRHCEWPRLSRPKNTKTATLVAINSTTNPTVVAPAIQV